MKRCGVIFNQLKGKWVSGESLFVGVRLPYRTFNDLLTLDPLDLMGNSEAEAEPRGDKL